ncbi:helix-turn-helix transcriptional regulator [Puia dinghuensis]|uniref:AraC family transcriptional regulator n=1 Tax=Puia dinghuensis TaxID=1792502 RepID=A0A8J2UCF5_9BACT|nr:helix-turn-helix transcriptional regulator [Puia dinghuensis]GGA98430.1 AraC family transcriptional regulator [Puia dinghuensis]
MQDIFSDGRLVLSCKDDIRMVYYRQREAAEKTYLQLEESTLTFVLHGRKWLYHAFGKLEIGAGEGFFMSPGNYLRSERLADSLHGYASLVIGLSGEFLASLDGLSEDESLAAGQRQPIIRLEQDALLMGLIAQLADYFDSPGEKARVEAILPFKIRELLTLLLTAPANKGLDVLLRQGPSENPLTLLMEAHFREALSLGQLAFLAGHSLSSFKRKFEAIHHMSPKRWILQRRLKEAYSLLEDRSRNVTEVCYAVGFENLPHFVQLFKQRYHITPKQRQLHPAHSYLASMGVPEPVLGVDVL